MKILGNLRYGLSWVVGEKFISGGFFVVVKLQEQLFYCLCVRAYVCLLKRV